MLITKAPILRSRAARANTEVFGERQLGFVANVLRETESTRLVAAFMHIPLRNYLDPDDPSTNVADRAKIPGAPPGTPTRRNITISARPKVFWIPRRIIIMC